VGNTGSLNFEAIRDCLSGNRLIGTVILTHHPDCQRKRDNDKWLYDCNPSCHVLELGDKANFFLQEDFYYEQHWSNSIAQKLSESNPVFYHPLVGTTERYEGCPTNNHATLKPIKLWQDLSRLFLPPELYQPRLLVPCSGAGSEVIGAMYGGFKHIVGVELEKNHINIAKERLTFYHHRPNYYTHFKQLKLTN